VKPFLLFVFSNKTQFETAIPLFTLLKAQYRFAAIFNVSNANYAKGLDAYERQYAQMFAYRLSLGASKGLRGKIGRLFRVKGFVKGLLAKNTVHASVQFTEGADIDWLVIGLLKEARVKSVVIQWAVTWEPSYYDALHRMQGSVRFAAFKRKIVSLAKVLIGMPYPTMRYYGDGASDYILTMGEFWTEQFLRHHPYKGKFVTTGNPRFVSLSSLRRFPDKRHILFVTGAATVLYGYTKRKHLQDIEEVYAGYRKSGARGKLIHKVHPRDKYREEIVRLAESFDGVEVETEASVESLLPEIFVTIIIRSTVGLEALAAGSRLIVYNNARQMIGFNYASYGLAHEVQNAESLASALEYSDMIVRPSFEKVSLFIKTERVLEDVCDVIAR